MQFTIRRMLVCILLVATFFGGWQLGIRSGNRASAVSGDAWDSDPAVYMHIFDDVIDFNPKSFKADIEKMIGDRDYTSAIATLMLASEDEIIAFQPVPSYIAIDKCSSVIDPKSIISLPGTEISYDSDRDWIVPDSGLDSVSYQWNAYSRIFARRYNKKVDEKLGNNR